MSDCNQCDSPRGSNVDSLIEQLRCEITKSCEEDLVNIKKVTIQASNKSREPCQSSCDIDKKISELECQITKLQEELNELACASKQKDPCKPKDECGVPFCCPMANDCENTCPEEPISCPEEPIICAQDVIEEKCFVAEEKGCTPNDTVLDSSKLNSSSSNCLPITLRDIGHVQQEKEDTSQKTIFINAPSAEKIQEDISNVKQNILFDWERLKDENKDDDKPSEQAVDTQSITNMIAELRAELDETIHSLNENK